MKNKLKELVKANKFANFVNSRIKSGKLVYDSRRLKKYYANIVRQKGIQYSGSAVTEQIKLRSLQRGLNTAPLAKGDLRIFWVGSNYEQDNSGLLQGLSKFGEVIVFKNKAGEYGPETSPKLYDSERVGRNSDCLVKQVEKACEDGAIHLLIGQMWARLFSVDSLKEIQAKGIVTANIAWDDKLPFHWKSHYGIRPGAIDLAPGVDLTLQSSPELCVRYLAEGCLASYYPMASDPCIFEPCPEQKVHDVCFVGGNYGIREKIVKAIEKSGIKVECFGYGWPNGSIDARQTAKVFARSKIVLGVGTIAHCKKIITLKLRDFDAPMSGSFYLTHHNPDLEDLFEIGKEIETYRLVDECVKKVHYYLEHSLEREAIAKAGRQRVVRDHTWEKRFEKIFQQIGILKGPCDV